MILTTPIIGNAHQVFLNQPSALGLHGKRAGGVFFVKNLAIVVVRAIENSFCNKEVQVRVPFDNSLERIRYKCSIEILN